MRYFAESCPPVEFSSKDPQHHIKAAEGVESDECREVIGRCSAPINSEQKGEQKHESLSGN